MMKTTMAKHLRSRRLLQAMLVAALPVLLSACSTAGLARLALGPQKPVETKVAVAEPVAVEADAAPFEPLSYSDAPSRASNLDALIVRYAQTYDVPESLVRRVIKRESGFNPAARHGPYYGLMQIRHDTARSMGYQGAPNGLLDAETNLRYGVKYLAGAYKVGGRNPDRAMRNYSRGYYYDAKRQGLLKDVGLM